MHKGDLVQYLGGNGDDAGWIYGRVEACGHKTVTVRWENGVRNRFRRGKNGLKFIADAELRAEIRKSMSAYDT